MSLINPSTHQYSTLLALLLMLLMAPKVGAQEQAAAPSGEFELSIEFTAIAWEQEQEDVFFQSLGNEYAIYLPTRKRSDAFTYKGNNPLTFYRPSNEIGPDGLPIKIPVAQVQLNPAIKKQMLLFIPSGDDSTGALPYRVIAMDDSLSTFPKRSYRFFNLSDELVGVKLNDHKAALEKHKEAIIELDGDEAIVQLGIYAERGGELSDLYNARWPQRGDARYIVFIIESERIRNSLQTRSIIEYF